MGLPGPYDLLVHPRKHLFHPVLASERQPITALAPRLSELMSLIGNNGCGPDSETDLHDDVLHTQIEAATRETALVLSYASMAELLVFPDGRWMVIPCTASSYELTTEAPTIPSVSNEVLR